MSKALLDLIALDPSTGEPDSPVGAVLFIGVPLRGDIPRPIVWAKAAKSTPGRSSECAALDRSARLGEAMAQYLSNAYFYAVPQQWHGPVSVAWEAPFLHPAAGMENARTFGTLSAAVGIYLATLRLDPTLRGIPTWPIRPMEAATVYGGAKLKSPAKKAACRAWAQEYFGEGLWSNTPGVERGVREQEAIADATSVGVKAIEYWRLELLERGEE